VTARDLDPGDFLRLMHGQRPQSHGVDQLKNRGIGANPSASERIAVIAKIGLKRSKRTKSHITPERLNPRFHVAARTFPSPLPSSQFHFCRTIGLLATHSAHLFSATLLSEIRATPRPVRAPRFPSERGPAIRASNFAKLP
jgi:hypothetical protein